MHQGFGLGQRRRRGNGSLAPTETDQTAAAAGGDFTILAAGTPGSIVIGTAGNDVLGGAEFINDDTMSGQAGNDTIYGNTGNDTLFGEAGTDTLFGGFDNDTLDGGLDIDTLFGEEGNDLLNGGTGDTLSGSGDTLYGGNDTIYGAGGAETIFGGFDRDLHRQSGGRRRQPAHQRQHRRPCGRRPALRDRAHRHGRSVPSLPVPQASF